MEIQRQIRENNLEVQSFLRDLEQWEKSIKQGSSASGKSDRTKQHSAAQPPVRQVPGQAGNPEPSKDHEAQEQAQSPSVPLKKKDDETGSRRKTPRSIDRTGKASHTYDYYKEWDKLNVDSLLESSSEDEEDRPSTIPNGGPAGSSTQQGEQVQRKSASRGQDDSRERLDADQLKELGNEAFRSGSYQSAIKYYEKSHKVKASHVTLSNLSMALLKVGNYEKAEQVASSVLETDPENIKALGRRAAARAELNNLLGAAKDYERVLLLEPNNSDVTRNYSELVKQLLKMNDLEVPSTSTPIAISRKTEQSLLSTTNANKQDLHNVQTARAEDSNNAQGHFKPEDRSALVELSDKHYDNWVKQQPKSAMVFETLWKECAPDVPKRAGLLAAIPGERLKDMLVVGISAQFLFEAGEAALCALPVVPALRVLDAVSKVNRFSLIVLGMKRDHRKVLGSYSTRFIADIENDDDMANFIKLRSVWKF